MDGQTDEWMEAGIRWKNGKKNGNVLIIDAFN